MDLWQLHVFCRVVESKSFSRAGGAVHLSQPTVSSHIKDLEDHFGCRLIDRLARTAVPTGAGKLLYAYARRLLALRDETETAMSQYLGEIRGRLAVGGSTIPGVYILPRMIGAFVKDYPEVIISLEEGDTEKIIGDIVEGRLEAGVVGAETADRRLVQEKLISDEMCLTVPADHRWADGRSIDMGTLLKEPFIIREPGSGTLKSMRESMKNAGFDADNLNVVAEMGSTAAVIQGIRNGVGVSVVSRISVSDETGAGRLKTVAVQGLNLKRNFYLTFLGNITLSPLAEKFVAFVRRAAKHNGCEHRQTGSSSPLKFRRNSS